MWTNGKRLETVYLIWFSERGESVKRSFVMEPCSMETKEQRDACISDETDSVPQIELSTRNNFPDKMGSVLPNTLRGHTIFQYPYFEWIPKTVFHAEYSSRIKTFDKWPKQMRPYPEELAHCGFFYKGYGDSVECFFCGICLHDWEIKDNAISEHKKWSPFCKFVNMIRHL